jgi:hypothetical protein
MSQDVLKCKPWVCTDSPRLLRASFLITQDQDAVQHEQHILKRLSQLFRLETLRLIRGNSGPSVEVLEFRLETGLVQLATLKRLKSLELGDGTKRLNVEDAMVRFVCG